MVDAPVMTESRSEDDQVKNAELTAKIIAAYVSNNTISVGELPVLIEKVSGTVEQMISGNFKASSKPLEPAVPIKKSIMPDYIICLEDGKKFKSMRRHLRITYSMSPEAYREKWGLPRDYPMVAPNYAQKRSLLAKDMRLGQKDKK